MNAMLLKRIGLFVVSGIVGFIATFITVEFVGTNLEEYGGVYTFFTALSFAVIVGVWLDKFLDTGLMPK